MTPQSEPVYAGPHLSPPCVSDVIFEPTIAQGRPQPRPSRHLSTTSSTVPLLAGGYKRRDPPAANFADIRGSPPAGLARECGIWRRCSKLIRAVPGQNWLSISRNTCRQMHGPPYSEIGLWQNSLDKTQSATKQCSQKRQQCVTDSSQPQVQIVLYLITYNQNM